MVPSFFQGWSPEEFSLFFNGAIFYSISRINSIPLLNDFGEVAQNFLIDTFGKSDIWENKNRFGKTPLHPDFYIVYAHTENSDKLDLEKLVYINNSNDIFILVPENLKFDDFVEYFIQSTFNAFEDFFECVNICENLSDSIGKIDSENLLLRELLSKYFSQNWFKRTFNGMSGDIRELLGKMHMSLFEISTYELNLNNELYKIVKLIERKPFLFCLSDYFKEQLKPYKNCDKSAQLTTMNFAAEEANNSSINKSTLFAAFIGALVGGLLTLIIQLVTK